ncbi:hypothetical protein [Actinotignum schaalii]|uniref:Uncharacterized protein n=1 Tax=Actinotignum schaalii FB123-CNA-2 TaxID=883067 RepID=S2VLV0_9ACTO|nr:hypothetical protein [Actinotignum schaalii]EPD27040.1 hypothetical protein HMPREF9237_00976 [Actinotignum schaalii FB123-CNA-2]
MAFLDLMQQLFQHTRAPEADTATAQVLRDRLAEDPNDVEAFTQLVGLAREAEGELPPADPLTAELTGTGSILSADLAIYALAEELSSSPASWYPQLHMARLAVESDPERALRLLTTATDRNPDGRILARAMAILREAGHPDQALSLGLAHWDPATHSFEAGEALVRTALAAGRTNEARAYLREMEPYASAAELAELREAARAAE